MKIKENKTANIEKVIDKANKNRNNFIRRFFSNIKSKLIMVLTGRNNSDNNLSRKIESDNYSAQNELIFSKFEFDKYPDSMINVLLPEEIEEKLSMVDWSVWDVMVGTVRTKEQLEYNIENCCYYVPARFISDEHLPKYIALHEEDVETESGIKKYGEIISAHKVRRGKIPVSMRNTTNPNEYYYFFTISKWIDLPHKIIIVDTSRGKPEFTNKFLLEHCSKSYQLFEIASSAEYRLMFQINELFEKYKTADIYDNTVICRFNENVFIVISDDVIMIVNDIGDVISVITMNNYEKSLRKGFEKFKMVLKNMYVVR